MIIAAHPDDDILGCGGYLAKYSQEQIIRVIFIAEGSSCRFSNLKEDKDLIKQAIEKIFKVKVEKVNTLIDTTGEKRAYVKFSQDTPAIDIATNLGLMG